MTPTERAAQIWCKPYMASKEMDVELCSLIAAEIEAAIAEEREANAKIAEDHGIFSPHIDDICTMGPKCDICGNSIGLEIRQRGRKV